MTQKEQFVVHFVCLALLTNCFLFLGNKNRISRGGEIRSEEDSHNKIEFKTVGQKLKDTEKKTAKRKGKTHP